MFKYQLMLEKRITELKDPEQVNMFLIAMIEMAYKLNQIIPNPELQIYNIFSSPLLTFSTRKSERNSRLERESLDVGDKILMGNLFVQNKIPLRAPIYHSLLETLTVRPKKKHYKKLVEYLLKHEKEENVSPMVLDHLTQVAINLNYPLTIGKYMRDFIVQRDFFIHKSTFMKFIMFLERSKGLEEDSKKFLLLSRQSSYLQIDFKMIQPLIQRLIKYKGGPEVIKLFEQLRKNITLNKQWDKVQYQDKSHLIKKLRKDFFDGMVLELLEAKSFQLSEIVMNEMLKEKFEITEADQIVAMRIYASQKKLEEFTAKFNLFIDRNGTYEFSAEVAKELGNNLMMFKSDQYKSKRLVMATKIFNRMSEDLMVVEGELLHILAYVFTESQQWDELIKMLDYFNNNALCYPEIRTVRYLKQNLVYCFQNTTRLQLQEKIEFFERLFFNSTNRAKRQEQMNKMLAESQVR
mmetsp:Transcript_4313/g.7289  ORF Transcript_4313/g.7289 Transcript_4313/m.7289 type:complete len:464 (-) Transcript_4313:184-1575(-)